MDLRRRRVPRGTTSLRRSEELRHRDRHERHECHHRHRGPRPPRGAATSTSLDHTGRALIQLGDPLLRAGAQSLSEPFVDAHQRSSPSSPSDLGEPRPPAMQHRTHGGLGPVEDLRDVGDRQILHVEQDQRGLLVYGQRPDGGRQVDVGDRNPRRVHRVGVRAPRGAARAGSSAPPCGWPRVVPRHRAARSVPPWPNERRAVRTRPARCPRPGRDRARSSAPCARSPGTPVGRTPRRSPRMPSHRPSRAGVRTRSPTRPIVSPIPCPSPRRAPSLVHIRTQTRPARNVASDGPMAPQG